MNMPKVQFIDMPMKSEANMIHCFLLPDEWGWNRHIIKAHPTLKKTLLLKNKKDQLAFIKKYISSLRKNNAKTLKRKKEGYEKSWRKIEKEFFMTLSEIFEIDWLKSRKKY